MDQRVPEYREPASSRADIIRASGVDPAAVDATGLPVEEISCGAPFSFVPVQTRAAVDAAEPDMGALRRLKSAFPGGHVGVFMFSTEPVEPASRPTAACSRRRRASPKIPPPAAPAVRSAATW